MFGVIQRTSLFVMLTLMVVSVMAQDFAAKVNPFIGTGGHGHTFPGATVPFGMMQLSPDTRIDGSWDGCSGYHYSDSLIYGFSHTHLSGTGVSDYGDLAILPVTTIGKKEFQFVETDYKKHAVGFSHNNEKAEPGYYSVKLNNGVLAEFTTTLHCGMHRYSFPKGTLPALFFQIDHRDETIESSVNMLDLKTISGFRRSNSWARDQHFYFYLQFSSPVAYKREIITPHGKNYILCFPKLAGKSLEIRIGISMVSEEGAKKNLLQEIPKFDFENVKTQARALWNKELSKIEVKGNTEERKTIFYTALYHAMTQPNVAMDVDSLYRGRDNKVHKANGFTYYTVFSLWDTFRAAHPLYSIIDRKRTSDFIKTFLAQHEQGGRLPVWELASNETDCMIGYHSVSVIADAFMKGIQNYDTEKAFTAMRETSMKDVYGLKAFMKNYYLGVEDEHESVSKALEYAYDDWCIGIIAEQLGKKNFMAAYYRRAQAWKNMFDPSTRFMRPRKNGAWLTPFDPFEVNNYFTEGNSWQYSFFVPHDVYGLMEMHGGKNKFHDRVLELFTATEKTTGREQADITGLIGQYAHGNEPSHHMAYLFNFTDHPEMTQALVRRILNDFYKNDPDGLIGNEDCGQMSAWYVLSSMGFYSFAPGIPYYTVGSPEFDEVIIHQEDGPDFRIVAENASQKKYVKSVNGERKFWFSHADILEGNKIVLDMTDNPKEVPAPDSLLGDPFKINWKERSFTPVPYFGNGQETFRDSLKVELFSPVPGNPIYYTTDGTMPTHYSKLYQGPFYIHSSTTVQAIASYQNKFNSGVVTAAYHKIEHHWKVAIQSQYNPQYTAGGPEGLIDGLYGDLNWRKGRWQGYQNQDFEAVLDLGKPTSISEVHASFLEDTRAWIWLPTQVMFAFSNDGVQYSTDLVMNVDNIADAYSERLYRFDLKMDQSAMIRFVRIKAKNYGTLPAWHPGAGGKAFVFVDEIWVK
jgi:predicted alpha-1,2-mannosidase